MVFGLIQVQAGYLKDESAHVYPDSRMTVVLEELNEWLIVHELGHLFDIRCGSRPTKLLATEGVKDEKGALVTGTYRGGYDRYGGKRPPMNGYRSADWTTGDQIHPGWRPNGMNEFEDFADMFLNWVRKSFVPNKAGIALNSWMKYHMIEWLGE
jgi:hypothetical protein